MRLTAKKLAQGVAALVFCLSYGTLLLIWSTRYAPLSVESNASNLSDVDNNNNIKNHPIDSDSNVLIGFQERAPRSIIVEANSLQTNEVISDYKDYKSDKIVKSLTKLDDIFISVKTTKSFHESRLDVILRTWFVLAKQQTYFFTDGNDQTYNERTNGHLINTNCSSSHNRKALCCKMSVEFDTFLQSNKKWFCHFDDDNYVNIPQLVKLLQKYNPLEDWYLGKPSIRQPLEILKRDHTQKKISFWFATGGAGFCLSRSLALKMMPLASDGKFISIGEKIRLPDDVTIGYIVEYLLANKLTVVEQFHSHLEPMKFLKLDTLSDQVTFSYSRYGQEMNVLSFDEGIDIRNDPTRFLSLHCHLFPNFNFCPKR